MSHYMDAIERYGKYVTDLDVSPIESIDMLRRRSRLEKEINNMTDEERLKLLWFDLQLLDNAEAMSKHIEEVYDFSLSKQSPKEWWWHLHKVANKEWRVYFQSYTQVSPDVAL